jgi:hypothetical protein
MKPSHPYKLGQWQVFHKPSSLERSGFTAAGTVADSNRIPFSLQQILCVVTPKQNKDIRFFKIKPLLNLSDINSC